MLYIRFPSVVKSIYTVLKLCGQKYSSCNRIVPFLWLFAFVFAARQQSCCRIPLFPLIVDVCPFVLVWNSIFFINLLITFEQCFINVSFIYNIFIFLYFYTFSTGADVNIKDNDGNTPLHLILGIQQKPQIPGVCKSYTFI